METETEIEQRISQLETVLFLFAKKHGYLEPWESNYSALAIDLVSEEYDRQKHGR